jgi:hypothetical protein
VIEFTVLAPNRASTDTRRTKKRIIWCIVDCEATRES